MVTLALICAAMYLMWQFLERANNPGYRCPMCGAKAEGAHSEECSWK